MDKLLRLQSLCKASIAVNINDHLVFYQSAEDFLNEEVDAFHLGERMISHEKVLEELDVCSDTFKRMVDSNTVIHVQFFPHTPIGSYSIYDSDLDKALDRCLATFK